jgi:ribonuclease BN (tRNA processing enzyme)
MIKLIVLGSGTSVPLSYRASPSLAFFIEDNIILFDIGPGTLRQLSKIGIGHERIKHIFLSHFHPDHTADLIHFLFATKYPPSFKKRKPFVISGSKGLSEFITRLQEAYDHWLNLPPEIMEIDEIDTQEKVERKYPGFKIITRSTNHTPNSLAYRLESRSGKSVVYSGDTGFCEEIIDLAKGADLLILECSFPDGKETELHLTPSQACRIATFAGVNRLLLIHFYPECLATDITAQCRKSYTGELILGSDFLHINI